MISTHLWRALEIQRTRPPAEWKQAIEDLPEEARDECRRYLRGMYYRAAVVRILEENKRCKTRKPLPPVPAGT